MIDDVEAQLLGRRSEVRAIESLVAAALGGDSAALAFVGPAGAGKTSLLREAARVATAGPAPLRILRARGIETEAEVAFAGLLELIRPVAGLISKLPPPQAGALEGALALAPSASTDRFSVSAATLAILGVAASEKPVLVLVDDLHWLDPPSAQAVLFAARSLWREGVAILLSSRPQSQTVAQLEGIACLEVGPLAEDDASALARLAAPRRLTNEEVEALVVGTGGNPLAILEAARSIGAAQDGLGGDFSPLPVAERIRAGVDRRLEGLTVGERRAVLLAAAAGTRSPTTLVRSALQQEGLSLGALDAAERLGLLRVGGDSIEFEHPLTRSAAYAAAGSSEQRSAHRALAIASPSDSAERAWHLSAAAVGADDEAADALEAAGHDALARGAPSSALRMFERAAALTLDRGLSARRRLLCGDAARLAGSVNRARDIITLALNETSDPLVRAEALGFLFEIDRWRAPIATADSIAIESERVASLDPARAATMLAEAATALARSGSIARGVEFAERALATLEEEGAVDDAVELSLLFTRVMDARATEVIAPLRALGTRLKSGPPAAQALAQLQQVAWIHTWVERFDDARDLLDHTVAVGRSQAPGTLPMALAMHGELDYRQGRWTDALADTTEAASLAADFGQPHPRGLALTCKARLEACLGRNQSCRTTAALASEIGASLGGKGSPVSAYGLPALGVLELGRERHEDAIPHLEGVVAAFRRGGIREPGVVLAHGDLIEAYALSGRRDDAFELLREFETLANATERRGARAIAARCAGILSDGGQAEASFSEALRLHEGVGMPFELFRTQLAFGRRLRRAGAPEKARVQLRASLRGFEGLGAQAWVARASDELSALRVGARRANPGENPVATVRPPMEDDGARTASRNCLAEEFLREGRHEDALAEFAKLSNAEPLEEAWHRGIMRCHAAAGQGSLALRQYHVCRSALRQSLSRDPGPETHDLYLAILTQR